MVVLAALLVVAVSYYSKEDVAYDEEYRKCTSVCSATLEEDFTTHYLCREQCKKELMERIQAKE